MFDLFRKKEPGTTRRDKRSGASARKRDEARYEQEKHLSVNGSKDERLQLARAPVTHQEILYYLAVHDPDTDVRLAVAQNDATPLQATTVLALDKNIDVRMALAHRLVTLLPTLESDRQSQLYAFAVQALGTLALDEVLKIRMALSSALKDYAHTPPKIASQLARDVEKAVSEPVLRFCITLADADLLDILKNHPASWAVQAIAGRESVSADVSQAIIETDDREAGTILIRNEGALITPETLEVIIDKASLYPEWQESVALRRNLPARMAQRLAAFADESVRDVLMNREDFDAEAIETISVIFRRRLEFSMPRVDGLDEDPVAKARRLAREGALDDDTITDAQAMRDYDFVYAAFALLLGTTPETVAGIFAMKAPRPIIALCWRAGLSMRTALELQKGAGQVPVKELIYPRDGVDYPLTPAEIDWQLDFLGLKTVD